MSAPTYHYDSTYGSHGGLIPTTGSGLPVIKIDKTALFLDPNKLANAINKRLQSPTEVIRLQRAGSEGILLEGITDPSQRVVGRSDYPGLNGPGHKFVNGPELFEIKALANTTRFIGASDPDSAYDGLALVISHEGGGHPFEGLHIWNHFPATAGAVLLDPVYSEDIQIDAELGVMEQVYNDYLDQYQKTKLFTSQVLALGASFSATFPDGQVYSNSSPAEVISLTGILNRGDVSQAQKDYIVNVINLNHSNPAADYYDVMLPSNVSGSYNAVRILTDSDYKLYVAEHQRNSLEAYYGYTHESTNGKDIENLSKSEMSFVERKISVAKFDAKIGSAIGSALGNYFANGNALAGILYSSVLGEIGERVGLAIAGFPNANSDEAESVVAATQGSFTADVWSRMQGAAIGTVSSMLAADLTKSLGLSGFGGELFSTTTSNVINKVISNLTDASANTTAFSGVFDKGKFVGGDLVSGAIGSFIGAKLGNLLVKPETEAAVVLSSIGSSIGPIIAGKIIGNALGKLGAVLVPGIGAFVGFVLGAVIGNLFGSKKPKVPTASAETVLQVPYARYELGTVTSANGGNLDLAESMAINARDILNGLIAQITHGDDKAYVSNISGSATTQAYGHTGSQLYVKVNGSQHNVTSADEAVEYGTLAAIRNTKIVGGDLFLKRAVRSSTATDLLAFSGDLQTAGDYEFYSNNRTLINGYIRDAYATLSSADQAFYDGGNKTIIDKILSGGTGALNSSELSTYNGNKGQFDRVIAAVGAQTVANPWIVTLERASELKLDQFAVSDFYGGLGGFLKGLGADQNSGAYYENATLRVRGAGATVSLSTPGSTTGIFDVLSQSLGAPDASDLVDGHFKYLTTGLWDVASNSTTGFDHGVNLNSDWAGSGNDSLWIHMGGTTNGQVTDHYSDFMTSAAGVTYEASVYAANHRGVAQAYVEYLDANKQHLAWAQLGGTARDGGGWHGDLANYNLLSGTSVAPSGTAYRRVMLRLLSNGGSDPYAFFTQPETHAVVSGAPALNWEDTGHAVYIDQVTKVGYTVTSYVQPGSGSPTTGWQVTSGNDLIDQSGSLSGVTLDDYRSFQVDTHSQAGIVTVTYTGGDDIFIGGQGNDTLNGRAGFDWLDGGAGNDLIYGGADNDILIGGAGNDQLWGDAGDDYLAAVSGNDVLRGGDGNDTLVGGTGGDSMIGGNGNDTLLMAADQAWNWYMGGSDFNFTDDASSVDLISAERFNVGVRFDLDYRPSDWNSNADSSIANPASRLAEVYNNATNQWLTSNGLISIEGAIGSEYDDTIYGTSGNNTLKGLAGADHLDGRDGNDILEGGAGADVLIGGAGSDTLSYEGSDAGVYVDLSTNTAYGGDAEGDTWSSIENLRGSRLGDELKGDGNQNVIEGLAGDDWIVATGGGNVTQTYSYSYNPYLDQPMQIPTGWTGGDIYNGGIGNDTVDYSEATSGITAYLGAYTATSASNGYGSSGMAQGHSYINIENIVGTAYADNLSAGAGAQSFEGGKGNDTLSGGAGADTYYFSRGDGSNVINESNTDNNVLSFASDVKFSDLYISSSGGGSGFLNVGIRGTGDVVKTNANFATLWNNRLKTLDVAGAGQLDISQITFQVSGGDDNANTLNGSGSNADWLFGFNGNDTLTGSGTAWEDKGNVFIGGLGDDTFIASVGDDQYAYDRGDGVDTITDTGGEDTIVFGATATADDVIYQVVGNDLYIGLKDPNDDTKTASQVADRIRVVNGGIVTSGVLNTIEFVQAGGTSVDLRKLDIAWTNGAGWNYNGVAPIALDLDGDGLNLSTVDDSNIIVQTAQGGLSKVGWVGPTDGFLAVDRDGDGKINKLSEISFIQDKPGATSDLEGLKTWDTNNDGLLDKNDANFDKILLWVDANQNGRSTSKELRTLTEAGIAAIDLNGVATGYTADMGIDSYVQNNMKFIWADGAEGDAYDVSLARHVLGSDGLYAGSYQSEWGSKDEDGTLGRLLNDPKAAAKAERLRSKKALLDSIGASYDEVKAQAQLDFSDNDRIDAQIAKRWEKMNKSEQVAWLSGQSTQVDDHIRSISSSDGLRATLLTGSNATNGLLNKAFEQARASVAQGPSFGEGKARIGSGGSNTNGGVSGQSFASSLASGAPDLSTTSSQDGAAADSSAGWWQNDNASSSGSSSQSLAALLADMDGAASREAGFGRPDDSSFAQQQLLLRQAVAGFSSDAGGSAAVWDHTAKADVPLAASNGMQQGAQNASAGFLLPA